jgi:uncharacterized protein (TIGR04255 family)
MTKVLPKRLVKEPLIDAIFEVRFISMSATPASVILPGFLFNKLEGKKSIEMLGAAQLPKHIRDADPNMRFAPLSRIDWNQFFINIGDASISISCKYPYPGWDTFKPAITKVITALTEVDIIESVGRYSIKYVDLIPSTNLREQVAMVNLEATIAGHKLEKEFFQFRIEIPRGNLINIIHMMASTTVELNDGTTKEGLLVDVDTIVNQESVSMQTLLESFSDKLEEIHRINKEIFFNCITTSTTELLEPIYE